MCDYVVLLALFVGCGLGPGTSTDWEEKAEELQARVWELEKQNANLKGKV